MQVLGQRRFGFTLVEVLIVVIVIAIIAAIAIPKMLYAQQSSLESSVKMQLKLARDALNRFNSDTGYWPIAADDLTGAAPAQVLNGGGQTKSLDSSLYKGPYVSGPVVPPAYANWLQYSFAPSTKGTFKCIQPGTALDGSAYSSW